MTSRTEFEAIAKRRLTKPTTPPSQRRPRRATASSPLGRSWREDIGAWRRALTCALPAGNGQIDWDDATEILTITVQWDPSRGAVLAEAEQFVMTTGL